MIANPEVQGGCNQGILGFSPVRAEISRFFSQTALHLDFLSNFRKSWYRANWDRFDAEQGDKAEAAEQGGAPAPPASRVARSEECQ